MHKNFDGGVVPDAFSAPRRAPSAGGRLSRDGLIEPEIFEALVAAGARAWDEILAMDETALDAALGEEEAAAIDELTGRRPTVAKVAVDSPLLRLVPTVEKDDLPVHGEHFRLRLAGIRDGLVASRREFERDVAEVRRLLMSSGGSVLTETFANLDGYLDDGRMLLVERIEHGVATLEGCVAYDYVELPHVPTGPAGPLVRRVVMRIRMLAVRGEDDSHRLTARLWLEAQLLGTVRLVQEGGPDCYGMLVAVADRNGLLPSWVERAGIDARLVWSDAKVAVSDRTLLAFRDQAIPDRGADGLRVSYRLAVANRARLLEAAELHRVGAMPFGERLQAGGVRFDYDVHDQLAGDVAAAVEALCARHPGALRRFGIDGPADVTVWGPVASEEMSVPIGGKGMECRVGLPDRRISH